MFSPPDLIMYLGAIDEIVAAIRIAAEQVAHAEPAVCENRERSFLAAFQYPLNTVGPSDRDFRRARRQKTSFHSVSTSRRSHSELMRLEKRCRHDARSKHRTRAWRQTRFSRAEAV